jgi:L-threonylcarbamoyladenylate synthase
MILDSGPTEIGLESTVLNLLGKHPSILRPGGITRENIYETIGVRPLLGYMKSKSKGEDIISPGTRHPHYHPKAKVILLDIKDKKKLNLEMTKQILKYQALHKSIGLLSFKHSSHTVDMEILLDMDYNIIAKSLFDSFRRFDDNKIDVILIPRMSTKQIGLAITDRMTRAASQIIKVT